MRVANFFIRAKNLRYGFDFYPAFRDWLVGQNGEGRVTSIEKVADELQAGDDELAALRIVNDWASGKGYQPAAVAIGVQVTDN